MFEENIRSGLMLQGISWCNISILLYQQVAYLLFSPIFSYSSAPICTPTFIELRTNPLSCLTGQDYQVLSGKYCSGYII